MKTRITPIERKRLDLDPKYTYLGRNMLMDEHPPSIREGMLEYITNDELAQYSNMERLYEKLGKYLAMEHDYIDSYSMENLLITYGVEGAFKMVFDTYDLVGESVGVLRPTCAMMHFLPKVFGTNIIELSGSAPN